MGLERNTTITEQDNAERTRQIQENQTREELHKQHGQELDAKRDISSQQDSPSSNPSDVKQPEKGDRDKLDDKATIEDAGGDGPVRTPEASAEQHPLDNNTQIGYDEGERQEKFKSKFDGENFTKEKSYDARATEETRDLVSKSVTPIREYNFGKDVKAGEPSVSYTKDEIQTLKAEREKIDAPNETTVMQKVIGVDTGNVHEDLKAYLDPRDRNTGAAKDADIYGFVSKAEDSAPFTKSPQECYDNLRLDYDNTVYKNPNQSVYVVRFTDGTNYDVPYGTEFCGTKEREQPCTGNGFIGNENNLIPEYEVHPEDGKGAVITDGVIYRINPVGSEEKVAKFNTRDNCFESINKGEENDSKL